MLNDEKIKELQRNKTLLELIKHRYEEQERVGTNLDNKSSNMISVLAVILTLETSFFIYILKPLLENNLFISHKIYLSIIFIVSIIMYFISFCLFIFSNMVVNKFLMTPGTNFIIDLGKNEVDELGIVKKMIAEFKKCIDNNFEILLSKGKKIRFGFISLLFGILLTILLVSYIIYIIW